MKLRALRTAIFCVCLALLFGFAIASVIPVARAVVAAANNGDDKTSGRATFEARPTPSMAQKLHNSPLVPGLAGTMLALLLIWALVELKTDGRRKKAAAANPAGDKRFPISGVVDLGKRYKALFENANDLIQGISLDGKLLYANTAWQELLDYNEHEIHSLSIFQVINPESLESFKRSFDRAVVGIKIKNLETTFVSKYGKRVVVEGSLHCELVDDRPVSIQGIFRDITERKRSESALKQSEERFSRVFAASPIPIAICTLEGGRIQDVNESFLKMLGYARNEVIGHTAANLGYWARPEDPARITEKIRAQKSVRDEQCQLRSKSGEIRQALISAELIELNTEPCLLLMIHDNTERLNLEAQLRQAQKMEGFGQLAAGVAHDFNNILTIIQGHASRLRQANGLQPQIGASVEQVTIAADRAANLTRQLLTFCRKQAMLPKVMDINETVAHVSTMLERILGEDIALDVKRGKDLPFISADAGMMELIIINLACNSRDAMPKGGRLIIATSSVNVNAAYAQQRAKARIGRHVCLTVTDTGCGMTPETLRRVFEPFFTTKDVGKGTGLGLATVYGIVDQHRGWIEVTSEVGKGTTFNIFLPETNEKSARPTRDTGSSSAHRGKETILLVEDELALRELARVVLEDYEYRVLEAGSGVQALKVWQQHKNEIDMLLTDMVMPEGMTGRELAERLQAEKPDIKVLYSSGYSPDVVGGCFKLPENSFFLAKPYQPPKLAQAVRECLDNVKHSGVVQPKVAEVA